MALILGPPFLCLPADGSPRNLGYLSWSTGFCSEPLLRLGGLSLVQGTLGQVTRKKTKEPPAALWHPLLALGLRVLPLLIFGSWLVLSGHNPYWYDEGKAILGVLNLMLLLWLLRQERTRFRRFLGTMTARDSGWSLAVGGSMVAISLVAYAVAESWLRVDGRNLLGLDPPLWLLVIKALVEPAWIAFVDGLLFFGYALPRLRDRLGTAWAVVIVALSFGLLHVGFAPQSLGHIVAEGILGMLLAVPPALITLKTRSVWPGFLGYLLMSLLNQWPSVLFTLWRLFNWSGTWVALFVGFIIMIFWLGMSRRP